MKGSLRAIKINGDWKKAKAFSTVNFDVENNNNTLDTETAMEAARSFLKDVAKTDLESITLVSSLGESHILKINDSVMLHIKRL